MRLRSFKLRTGERYVWVVPAIDLAGCPFGGPGVTLRDAPADRAIALAEPMLRTLATFEPGVRVKSLSIDLERARILGTLHPAALDGDARGRVIRVDGGPAFDLVVADARELIAYLEERATLSLTRRAGLPPPG